MFDLESDPKKAKRKPGKKSNPWTADVAEEARSNEAQIRTIIADGAPRESFDTFLTDFRKLLNPSVTEEMLIEMLGQHLVVSPVFDVLFEGYSFVKSNRISVHMEKFIGYLIEQGLVVNNERVEAYALTVKNDLVGADADAREELIKEIYGDFFLAVFPLTAKQLGIVYTPPEVVDFINKSIAYVLKEHFDVSLGDDRVVIIDPFTGTGTFITRMIKSGLIPKEDLGRKFLGASGDGTDGSVMAHEIVLLAYYIATINIEEALHAELGGEHPQFKGVVFGDTFLTLGGGKNVGG